MKPDRDLLTRVARALWEVLTTMTMINPSDERRDEIAHELAAAVRPIVWVSLGSMLVSDGIEALIPARVALLGEGIHVRISPSKAPQRVHVFAFRDPDVADAWAIQARRVVGLVA